MCQMNVLEAKTNFSKIIARAGKPVVKIIAFEKEDVSKRIGVAKGKFSIPDNFDESNEEIARMFGIID